MERFLSLLCAHLINGKNSNNLSDAQLTKTLLICGKCIQWAYYVLQPLYLPSAWKLKRKVKKKHLDHGYNKTHNEELIRINSFCFSLQMKSLGGFLIQSKPLKLPWHHLSHDINPRTMKDIMQLFMWARVGKRLKAATQKRHLRIGSTHMKPQPRPGQKRELLLKVFANGKPKQTVPSWVKSSWTEPSWTVWWKWGIWRLSFSMLNSSNISYHTADLKVSFVFLSI